MSIAILMPALSPTMEEGTLSKWFVKEGDPVAIGDVIAEIETDKATMEIEAADEGVVAKLLVAAGTENVKVKTPIAELASADAAALPAAPPPPRDAADGAVTAAKTEKSNMLSKPMGARILASPLARRLAAQRGLDLSAIAGTGPHGRVVKADIEAAPGFERRAGSSEPRGVDAAPRAQEIARIGGESGPPRDAAAVPFDPSEYVVAPLDGMRKTIARRMTQSFQEVPHFALSVDFDMERLLAARTQLNARLEHEGVKLSINDVLIRASALALKKTPDANVSYVDGALLRHKHAHVAVAVAIQGGLITPVIFHAEQKGLADISREMAALVERARARKLKPHEYEGGTFTISNLGMYGIKSFGSIINEPQSMIMSVGAGEQRPVVRNGAVTIANMATFTLTCDHRAVDGAIGAEFLQALRTFVEDPMTMML